MYLGNVDIDGHLSLKILNNLFDSSFGPVKRKYSLTPFTTSPHNLRFSTALGALDHHFEVAAVTPREGNTAVAILGLNVSEHLCTTVDEVSVVFGIHCHTYLHGLFQVAYLLLI